jgi:hypothetical protein
MNLSRFQLADDSNALSHNSSNGSASLALQAWTGGINYGGGGFVNSNAGPAPSSGSVLMAEAETQVTLLDLMSPAEQDEFMDDLELRNPRLASAIMDLLGDGDKCLFG